MKYVYRLDITYPEVDPRHPPDAWVCDMQDWGREDEWFHWPQERQFLSLKGAKNRAERLVRYGCIVEIERALIGEFTRLGTSKP